VLVRRVLLLALPLVLAFADGGCATITNMQEENRQKPYGGFLMGPTDFFGGDKSCETTAMLFWPMWLADKPLCLVGDTITLPYVLWIWRENGQPLKEKPAESAPTP
jgi:hypothetical protein